MKWYLTRICLLRSWKTGFFARARADLLSTLSCTAPGVSAEEITKQSSEPEGLSHAVEADVYSASQLDMATTCCLSDCQLTRHLSRKKKIPLVLLLVSMSPAWSLSLYPTKCVAPGHRG